MPVKRRKLLKPLDLLAAIGVLALFAVGGVVFYGAEVLSYDRCYDNVYINGQPVGGMSLTEIRGAIDDLQKSVDFHDIPVTVDGRSWTVSIHDIAARYDAVEAEQQVINLGRTGSVLERLATVFSLRVQPREYRLRVSYDEAALRSQVERIFADVNQASKDAQLTFDPEGAQPFVITDEVAGKTLDRDALLKTLMDRLEQGSFEPVAVQSQARVPAQTAEQLKGRTRLISSYTTALTEDGQRNRNITLAAEALSGRVLQPGEVFSFNDATGERTSQKGYVDGPVIANKQLVDAPGGGVCQVSTTLYNAALTAGLTIVERHHHSFPVSYVPAGLDSTVDYGRLDLRLGNNTTQPLYLLLKVDADAGTLTASLYGLPPQEHIEVQTDKLEEIPPGKPVEVKNTQRGKGHRVVLTQERYGCRVNVYRLIQKGGKTDRELVSEDYYEPVQGVIEVGTQPGKDEDNK